MSLPHYSALIYGKRDPVNEAENRAIREYGEYRAKLNRCVRRERLKATDPLVYSLYRTGWEYQERQNALTPNEQRILGGTLGIVSPALLPWPLLAAGTAIGGAGVGLLYDPEKFAQIKAQTEAELLRRLKQEEAQPEGQRRTVKQIYAALMNEVESGQLFSAAGPDFGRIGKGMLADLFERLQAEFDGGDNKAALSALRSKRLPPPSASVRQVAFREAVERKKAQEEQLKLNAQITEEYKELVMNQAAALNDRAAYNLEDRYLRGMAGEDRERLLKRFEDSTDAQRMADPTLRWLIGSSEATRANLKQRAVVAKRAAEIGKVARDHAAAYAGAYKFAVTFKVGGPDLHKALAAGTIAANSVASACDILATGGVATPLAALQMLGVVAELTGGLGGLFGGDAEDGLAKSLAELQRSILEAIRQLSLQVDRGFYMASLQLEEQRELSEALLLIATKDLRDARDGCVALEQVLAANPFSDDSKVVETLRLDANYERMDRCLMPLISGRDFSVTGAGAPSLMSLRYTTALDSAVEPNSFTARQWRSYVQVYVDVFYPALLRLLDHTLKESNEKADKAKFRDRTHYELLTGGGVDIEGLRERLDKNIDKSNTKLDLGVVMDPYDSRGTARTLRTALATPIDGNIAPTYLYPMVSVGPFLRLTSADFRPLPSNLPDAARRAIAFERDGVALALASSYWPTTMVLSAQERLKVGDVLLPAIDKLLMKGECDAAAAFDPNDTEGARTEKTLRIDACHSVRVFPELRDNLLHWRMREGADKLAKATGRAHGRLGWAYELVRQLNDETLSSFAGEMKTIWLTDDSGNAGKEMRRRHSRLSGRCDGITKTSEVAAKICEAGTCRAPLRRGDLVPETSETVKDDLALLEQLRVCVTAELPATQDFVAGRLRQSDAFYAAERLRALFADRVIGANVVSSAQRQLQGVARLALQP